VKPHPKVPKASRRKSPPNKPEASGLEMASFLVGLMLMMLGLGLLGNEINALLWRVRAKLFCVEGVARVEKTEILLREGAFEVEVTAHLELGARKYRSTSWIDRDDPHTASRDEAERWQAKFEVGHLYRCWYPPNDPTGFNELTPDGLQLGKPIARLWMPLTVFAIAWLFCRWPWNRWKVRGVGSQSGEPPPSTLEIGGRIPPQVEEAKKKGIR